MKLFLNSFFPEPEEDAQAQEVTEGMKSKTSKGSSPYILVEEADIKKILKPRKDFTHKGSYGHALIIAGQQDTMGAALLASQACLYAGAGLTTACIPESGLQSLNTLLPEVMYLSRKKLTKIDQKYTAIAAGPGLGQGNKQEQILEWLAGAGTPVVADADALNILAARKELLKAFPENSILTPHVKEFDRLFGEHKSWYQRLKTGVKEAHKNKCIIVLKNQYTFTIHPQGEVFINSTGNPAMAQGGMGDILTGLLVSYLAQGYEPIEAALIGCYIHGKAGDELAQAYFNLTASQVAGQVPKTVKSLLAI